MSIFLIYFEKKNPKASWTEFQNKKESVIEVFTEVNELGSQLKMESVEILLDGKVIPSFIIHDGVSSDRILQKKLKNDPVVYKQRIVIQKFIGNRLADHAFDHYFIFHLYHKAIQDREPITYDSIAEITLSDLMNFEFDDIRRNLLYKLIG
jgi:hypothetical protein